MAAKALLDVEFSYASYKEYVSDLAIIDYTYQDLFTFFTRYSTGNIIGPSKVSGPSLPSNGSVLIFDRCGAEIVTQEHIVQQSGPYTNINACISSIEDRPETSESRLIFIDYSRNTFNGDYHGVNADLIDFLGCKYRIHPEVMRWHFGSEYGLDRRIFPSAADPVPPALLSRRFLHLRNHYGLLSCCFCNSSKTSHTDTVIIFSRNHRFPHWRGLISSLMFLDASSPIPSVSQGPISRWANDLYIRILKGLANEEASSCAKNPVEFLISYAQMLLINATFVNEALGLKIMNPSARVSKNLEIVQDKAWKKSEEIRSNLVTLKFFTENSSSVKWNNMIGDYERVLATTEHQISVLTQKITYRAAMASLDESRAGIEHAKRGVEQNAQVKRLTQLAFIFIPLSFATSIFGMNLGALKAGTAQIWMVVVSIMITYASVCLMWVSIDYQKPLRRRFTRTLGLDR